MVRQAMHHRVLPPEPQNYLSSALAQLGTALVLPGYCLSATLAPSEYYTLNSTSATYVLPWNRRTFASVNSGSAVLVAWEDA